MSKVSIFITILFSLIFFVSCGDEAASDNDSGLTDNETVTDADTAEEDDSTAADENQTTDETADETADETVDNELSDDLSDEVLTESDEVADETVDEAQPDDDVAEGPSEEAILCCEEIVKEWFRCEGTYETTAIQGCVDCFALLLTCTDFYIAENSFGCSTECDAICEGTGSADNSGKDRRKVADGYCLFIMDKNCDITPEDVSSFGVVDGLDACYDK